MRMGWDGGEEGMVFIFLLFFSLFINILNMSLLLSTRVII